jgi:hypothetical protein
MMDAFLNSVKPEYAFLIKKILRIVSNANLVHDFLKRINHETMNRIREFLTQYKEAFHMDESMFASEPTAKDPPWMTYILNPYIEDLMGDNVFRLKHQDRTYLVPLWHPETVFEDETGEEFCVYCYPILPDNMDMDDANIVTVWLDLTVMDVWNRDTVEVQVGGKTIHVPTKTLKFTDKTQEVVVPNAGIPIANLKNVFDSSQRQAVHVQIRLSVHMG